MDRFIVGTGRCGSTLLSRMIAEHPDVLSLFEFFTGLGANERFGPQSISGARLAEIVSSEQPFVTAVMRRGYEVGEITYPFADIHSDARGRYGRSDPLPWILVSTLPRLDEDPDALFDALIRYAHTLPHQRPRDHYRQLFAWLGERYGRRHWIERSGSSIDYAAALLDEFPEARFVHIHRAGPEVALSMRNHHAYRLPIALIYDMPLEDGRRVSDLPPLDFDALPSADDTISRILSSRPPPEYFARYWSDQMIRGATAFASLPAERLLVVEFDALLQNPKPILEAIEVFFELSSERRDATWMDRAAGLIHGAPAHRADDLDADSRARLDAACDPGVRSLPD